MYTLRTCPDGFVIDLDGLPLLTMDGEEAAFLARAWRRMTRSHALRGKDFLHGLILGIWYATRTGHCPSWALDLLPSDLARETAFWEEARSEEQEARRGEA